MLCGATQNGRVKVERSDRMWPTGEGNGKLLQYFCLRTVWNVWNSMNSMEKLPSVFKSASFHSSYRKCKYHWITGMGRKPSKKQHLIVINLQYCCRKVVIIISLFCVWVAGVLPDLWGIQGWLSAALTLADALWKKSPVVLRRPILRVLYTKSKPRF